MRHLPNILILIVAAGLAGCVDTNAGSPMVVNAAASDLSIQPSIIDADPAPSDGMVPIVIQFYQGNTFVELAAGNVVTCNGMPVPIGNLGYTARVPLVAAGGDVVFALTRGTTVTKATVKVPPRPEVMSPIAGASLVRSITFPITYVPTTSAGVRPTASDTAIGLSGSEQPDNGMAVIDVSALRVGSGTVQLSRRYLSVLPGTGFKAAIATYTISSAEVPVSWQ